MDCEVVFGKKLLVSYLKTFRTDVNVNDIYFLAEGTCAMAFAYKDRVFKITNDLEDFRLAKMIYQKEFKTFTKCFFTDAIKFDEEECYIIETKNEGHTVEFLYEDNDEFMYSLFGNMCSFFRYYEGNFTQFPNVIEKFCDYANQDLDMPYEGNILDTIQNVFNFFEKVTEEFKQVNGRMNSFDFHQKNICFNGEEYKVIDYGYAGGKEFTDEERDINYKEITVCV